MGKLLPAHLTTEFENYKLNLMKYIGENMKQTKAFINFVLLIMTLVTVVGGCSMNNSLLNENFDPAEYLNNKYSDDTFTYLGRYGGTFDNDKNEYEIKSSKYPERSVWVALYSDGRVIDNYLGIKYYKETEEKINTIVYSVCKNNNYYIDNEVNISRSSIGNTDNNVSFEQYAANKSANIKINAIVDSNSMAMGKEAFLELISEEIKNSGICFTIVDVYFVDEWTDELKNSYFAETLIADDKYISELYGTLNEKNQMNWEWIK